MEKRVRKRSDSPTNSGFVDLIIPGTSSYHLRTSKIGRQASEPIKSIGISGKYSFSKQDDKTKKTAIIYPAPHPDYEAVSPPLAQVKQGVTSENNRLVSSGKSPATKALSSSKTHHSITRQHACEQCGDRRPIQEDADDGQPKTQNPPTVEMNYQSTANTSRANEKDALLPENHSSSTTLTDHIQIEKPSQELPTSFRLLYHYRIKEAFFILFLFLLVMAFTLWPHFMGDKKACEEGYFKCVVTKTSKYEPDYKCCQNGDTCCTDAAGYGSCCAPGSVCCSGACCSKTDKKCCGDICIPLDYDCCLAGVYCSQYYKCCIAASIVQCCHDNVLCNENTYCGEPPSKYR